MSELTHCPTAEELADHLSAPLGSKDRFGRDGAAVLVTAGLVAAANSSWDKGTISTFRDNQKLHPKVWDKLVAINKDLRLLPLQKDLPASYTAIYALVVMSKEELKAAEAESVIKSNASSRSILDWTKAYRLRGTGIEQEMPLTLVLREDLTAEQHQGLMFALSQVAKEFGAEVLKGKGGVKQAEVKSDQRKVRAAEIDEELTHLLGPVVASAPDDLMRQFQITSAADLIEGTRQTFTGFLQVLEGRGDQKVFWTKYGRAYCLKYARDFNLSESRAERYQLKKRVMMTLERWGIESNLAGFQQIAESIISNYMRR